MSQIRKRIVNPGNTQIGPDVVEQVKPVIAPKPKKRKKSKRKLHE